MPTRNELPPIGADLVADLNAELRNLRPRAKGYETCEAVMSIFEAVANRYLAQNMAQVSIKDH